MYLKRNISEISKLPNNPRFIKDKDFEKLVTSIKDNPDYFEARPLILSNRTGKLIIIAGNQRYEAAKELGLKEVPTFLIEDLNEAREREIIIRDNVNNGSWDFEALANEWDVDELADWGVDVPSFDTQDEDPEEKIYTPTFKFEVECKTEGERNKLMAELMGRGINCTDDY